MQDKDFDQLFKDRLDDAEIQPSAGLWNNIQKEIKPKKQRKLPVFWLAAASVVIMVGIVLLLNKPERIQLRRQAATAANVAELKADVAELKANPAAVKSKAASAKGHLAPVKADSHRQTTKINSTSTNAGLLAQTAGKVSPKSRPTATNQAVAKEENSLLAMQPITGKSHLPGTEPDTKLSDNSLSVAAELPAVQVAVAGITNSKANTEEPTAIATEVPEEEQTGRMRIRNAADLVNFVVDKLDKREQKILEFRTDDDDNTSLVAINIGPFKLNTRKHK